MVNKVYTSALQTTHPLRPTTIIVSICSAPFHIKSLWVSLFTSQCLNHTEIFYFTLIQGSNFIKKHQTLIIMLLQRQ